jgi:hypothetical protein
MECHGTHQGHGMPWHPPRQAKASQGTRKGRPWLATAHTLAGHGMPLTSVSGAHGHAMASTLAGYDMPLTSVYGAYGHATAPT